MFITNTRSGELLTRKTIDNEIQQMEMTETPRMVTLFPFVRFHAIYGTYNAIKQLYL